MRQPYGFVYITTNNLNGKKYIGQCSYKNKKWSVYLGSGKALRRSIEKNGEHNFSKEIICHCFSREDLNLVEELLIKEYGAVESPMYYNIAHSAYATMGFKGRKHTEDWKENRRKAGRTRPATEKMRENARKLGKMPKNENQMAAAKRNAKLMGEKNARPKETRTYTCFACQKDFQVEEYQHHPFRVEPVCPKDKKCIGVKISKKKAEKRAKPFDSKSKE